jgi:glucosamine--fructose-6-phosphate aminotransferase (isomerizing)
VIARGFQPIVIADAEFSSAYLNLKNDIPIVRVPKTVDCLQNILMGIPIQLIASHLARINVKFTQNKI